MYLHVFYKIKLILSDKYGVFFFIRGKYTKSTWLVLITCQHQYAYSPNCSLYNSYGADKENCFFDIVKRH